MIIRELCKRYTTPHEIIVLFTCVKSLYNSLQGLGLGLTVDFFQNQLFGNILSGIPSVSNSLDLDQDQHLVGPDLGPNCLQR